jgi:hypothetical protein
MPPKTPTALAADSSLKTSMIDYNAALKYQF